MFFCTHNVKINLQDDHHFSHLRMAYDVQKLINPFIFRITRVLYIGITAVTSALLIVIVAAM